MTNIDDVEIDVEDMISTVDGMATGDGPATAICAGTFIAYPMPNGGIHLVAQITQSAPGLGIPLGEFRRTIPAAMLRMFAAAANAGGGMLGMLRGIGRRR